MIKVSVRDIPAKGLDIDQSVFLEEIGLSVKEVDVRSKLHVKAHLDIADGFIIANTHINAQFGYCCARCLQELSSVEDRSYVFDIELANGIEDVDLGEEIRQELILSIPPKILCKKDCKGICPQCGANLNKEQCKCK